MSGGSPINVNGRAVYAPEQGSPEWHALRAALFNGTELASVPYSQQGTPQERALAMLRGGTPMPGSGAVSDAEAQAAGAALPSLPPPSWGKRGGTPTPFAGGLPPGLLDLSTMYSRKGK